MRILLFVEALANSYLSQTIAKGRRPSLPEQVEFASDSDACVYVTTCDYSSFVTRLSKIDKFIWP